MASLSALIALTALHQPRLWRHSFPDLCSLTSYPSLLPNLLYNSSYEKEITTMPQSECLEISLTKRSFELYTNVLASSPIPNGFLFCKDFWATRIKIDVYHLRTSLACCFKLFHIFPQTSPETPRNRTVGLLWQNPISGTISLLFSSQRLNYLWEAT